jgi:signal recognition particle subunit SRP19
MRKQKKTILWPVYFDVSKTKKEGRRVPKSFAIPNPTLAELQKAAESLGLKPEINVEAVHPAAPWRKTGRILVEKSGTKMQTLTKVAKRLLTIRQQTTK